MFAKKIKPEPACSLYPFAEIPAESLETLFTPEGERSFFVTLKNDKISGFRVDLRGVPFRVAQPVTLTVGFIPRAEALVAAVYHLPDSTRLTIFAPVRVSPTSRRIYTPPPPPTRERSAPSPLFKPAGAELVGYPTEPGWITSAEAAEMLQCSVNSVIDRVQKFGLKREKRLITYKHRPALTNFYRREEIQALAKFYPRPKHSPHMSEDMRQTIIAAVQAARTQHPARV